MKFKIEGNPKDYYTKNDDGYVINEDKIKLLAESVYKCEDSSEVIFDFFKDLPNEVSCNIYKIIFDEADRQHDEKMLKMKKEYKNSQIKDKIISLLILVVIIFGLIFGGYKLFSHSEPKCDTDVGAFVISQNFVKKKLKYPSSAVFPYIDDNAVHVYGDMDKKGLDVCEYNVHGYVESKNDFGIMINNKYTVDLKYNIKKDSWVATQVFIE
jgi:hypothetical protein